MSTPQGRDEIQKFADQCRDQANSASTRPGTVARLVLADGNTFLGTSSFEREGRKVHPIVAEAYNDVPRHNRSVFHLKCAETDAISTALFDAENQQGRSITRHEATEILQGAMIQTAKVRGTNDPQHGVPHPPCSSCRWVLDILGIKYAEDESP